jgi:hypothetical protein
MKNDFKMVLRKKDYDKALRKLEALGESAIRRGMRESLRAAAKPGIKSMRTKTATESKALRRSIGVRVKAYPASKNAYAIVGPRRGVTSVWNGKRRAPVFYAHLINNGFNHVRSGRSIAGTHFVDRALADSKGAMRRAYNQEIGKRIMKHAHRLAKK